MYVVLGANGRAGGETALALIGMGKAVRVVLRHPEHADKWTKLGADVAIADIDDVRGLAEALKGAAGAFLLSPPPVGGDVYKRSEQIGAALADAVRLARLPKFVALSSIGAQHESGTGVIATLNQLEKHLSAAAPASAFLRSGYFIETWSEAAPVVHRDAVLPSFLEPSQKIAMVSTIDVGRTAAGLLCQQFSGQRVIELRGPEDWSANDVAAAFEGALNRSVKVAFVAPGDRAGVLRMEGVPQDVAAALVGMYEGIAGGRFEHEAGTEQRRGIVSLADAVGRIVRT